MMFDNILIKTFIPDKNTVTFIIFLYSSLTSNKYHAYFIQFIFS